MTIATFLLLVNTVFSVCGLFVFIKLLRKSKKGYQMKFEQVPELSNEKPMKSEEKAFASLFTDSEDIPEVVKAEAESLSMDDVMAAMRALGVK